MKRLAILTLCVLTLAGCSPAPTVDQTRQGADANYDSSDFSEVQVKLRDGRTVLCLKTGSYGAVSCDWEAAK